MEFYEWLIALSQLVGVVVGTVQYRRLSPSMKFLFYFFFCSFILEIVADYRVAVYHRNNLAYYHAMTVVQYIFLSLLFRASISSVSVKKSILISIVVVFVCEALLLVTIQHSHQSPSLIRLITRLLLLYWILSYLRSLLNTEDPVPLLSIPVFWVCLGLLVRFISFLQVGLLNYMINTDGKAALFWFHFSVWFDALFYLFCAYALWVASTQPARKIQYG